MTFFFFTFQDMRKLNGMFAYHLQVALIHQQVWDALLDLFTAWKKKEIHGQGNGDLMAYHFKNMTKGKNSHLRSEEQELLIRTLIEGKISINEFRRGIPDEVSR